MLVGAPASPGVPAYPACTRLPPGCARSDPSACRHPCHPCQPWCALPPPPQDLAPDEPLTVEGMANDTTDFIQVGGRASRDCIQVAGVGVRAVGCSHSLATRWFPSRPRWPAQLLLPHPLTTAPNPQALDLPRPPNVLGLSMGGFIATALAALHGEELEKVRCTGPLAGVGGGVGVGKPSWQAAALPAGLEQSAQALCSIWQ